MHSSSRLPLFIPVVHFAFVFIPPQEQSEPRKPAFVKTAGLILATFLLAIGATALSHVLEDMMDEQRMESQDDLDFRKKALFYFAQANGLEKTLSIIARPIQTPMKVSDDVTLESVVVQGDTIRYIHRVIGLEGPFSQLWYDSAKANWCSQDEFQLIMATGATIEGLYLSGQNETLGTLGMNSALCHS